MKPFINLQDTIEFENGNSQAHLAHINVELDARKLGYNVTIVPPGKKACPFHNHRISDMPGYFDGED